MDTDSSELMSVFKIFTDAAYRFYRTKCEEQSAAKRGINEDVTPRFKNWPVLKPAARFKTGQPVLKRSTRFKTQDLPDRF